MMPVNSWDSLTAARLLDFFGAKTSWSRTLWNSGLVLSLLEILEASEARQENVLSDAALAFMVNAAKPAAGLDLGVGRRIAPLQTALVRELRPKTVNFFSLAQQAQEIQQEYLANWTAAIRSRAGGSMPNAERVARAVASHLLDLGFSPQYLHRWWTYRLEHERPRRSIVDLIDEAHALAISPPRTFEVLIAFELFPAGTSSRPNGWLNNAAVAAWLVANSFSTSGIKQNGGIILSLEARDSYAAALLASETIENLAARARIAISSSSNALIRLPEIWVKGDAKPHKIGSRGRALNVRALIREGVVYQNISGDEQIEAALEMLGPLHDGTPIGAIGSGWGAIESLLADGEKVEAADRLAAIVTCSYPRSELTSLSYALETDDAVMQTTLRGVTVNRDRAGAVATAINAGQQLTLSRPSDKAALQRLTTLLARPADELGDIQAHLAASFRRLYRQRNLVLHGGKTKAVALRASLRTAAPLVGAGFDRIAHAHYVNHLQPKALAAHARSALQLIEGHLSCVTLLP